MRPHVHIAFLSEHKFAHINQKSMQGDTFMARRNNEATSAVDKAKVRVFFAEVEGNNESVQEALRTMVSAMNRPVRLIPDPKANGNAAVFLPQADIEVVDEPSSQVEEDNALDEEPTPSNIRKTRGTGKKIDRNAGLTLVPDLNFRPSGKQAFKEFIDGKNPKNDLEATLATVHYMQHSMGLSKIGPAHVVTAFKEAGKPVPVDVKQTIRNIKSRKIWLTFTDIEDVRTTTQGDNFVDHEMGKS